MTEKIHIIDALGEAKLLLPALLNEALSANDRCKYFFSLLQVARSHAERPEAPHADLRAERLASGIEDECLDGVVVATSLGDAGLYRIPRAGEICERIEAELARMLEPLRIAGEHGEEANGEVAGFVTRFKSLSALPWCNSIDEISSDQIARLTSGDRRRGDSVHLLVMDLHKALNALQARIASESIDGARAYDLRHGDRPLVSAFMAGVNRTAALKLDHPGLGTTATRSRDRLVLQNDIGTTDAHVLVVHVDELTVTFTYTDVHMQRLLFFQSLFDGWRVQWEDTLSRTDRSTDDGVYHLCIATFASADRAELARYLAFLGSRLVFLIDWNRARKRLRLLLPKDDTLGLLKWAADNDLGHMAFLKAGGEQMIFDALAFVAQVPLKFGGRLDDLLGREAAIDYMKFVFSACTHGLAEGRSESLVRDEVRAELVYYLHSAQENLLDIAVEHASFCVEIAAGIRDGMLAAPDADVRQIFQRNASNAEKWEHQADEKVNQARSIARRSERADFYCRLVESADDIADELEEAAFHLTLVDDGATTGAASALASLTTLAGLLVGGTQEYLKALETARTVHRGSPREDMQDFLEAIHRISTVEHQSDQAQRAVKIALVASSADLRGFYAYAECARNLEAAADALMHTGLQLRDHILGEVIVE
jgi:uncharacterized protein Yka (UPF0111/DUF47 family)